jgi:predicted tellurium resistance membrane protein TerC
MTSEQILLVLSVVMIVWLDALLCWRLKNLVYSFLLSKRNIKGAKKIHDQQTKKDRFTLKYIEQHAIYPKEFRFFQSFRMIYLYSLLPVYAILGTLFLISQNVFLISIGVIIAIKLCIVAYICFHFWTQSISVYDKRYKERKKRKK